MTVALDLFCGMGGWSLALAQLGWPVVGVDLDRDACRSHHAAGHDTIRADITTLDPHWFPTPDLLAGSPPCTDYSRAGKRQGLNGTTGQLVWEPLRFIRVLRPRAVALEQVPDVLPIWRMVAAELDRLGYSTWTGCLSAEQYGVPQTRNRAFLIARLDAPAVPPEPTHQRYVPGEPARAGEAGLFGSGLAPWVSMADALGWGMTDRPGLTYAPGTASGGPDIAGGSGARAVLREAQINGAWLHDNQPNSTRRRLTVEQALILQGFPPDHPLHGTKTSQFRQIGNAVCPPVAHAIGRQLAAHLGAAA